STRPPGNRYTPAATDRRGTPRRAPSPPGRSRSFPRRSCRQIRRNRLVEFVPETGELRGQHPLDGSPGKGRVVRRVRRFTGRLIPPRQLDWGGHAGVGQHPVEVVFEALVAQVAIHAFGQRVDQPVVLRLPFFAGHPPGVEAPLRQLPEQPAVEAERPGEPHTLPGPPYAPGQVRLLGRSSTEPTRLMLQLLVSPRSHQPLILRHEAVVGVADRREHRVLAPLPG